MNVNIPEYKLPAGMQARRAVLSAMTGRSGVEAEAIANADAQLDNVGLPTYTTLLAAVEKVWSSGHPDATEHMAELRGISNAEFGQRLVRIAGTALGQV